MSIRVANCHPKIACDEFKSWSDSSDLIHLPTVGAEFTWTNKRRGSAHTERRLDRVVCNDPLINYWGSSTCCTLPRSKSDHHPILLKLQKDIATFSSSFKFLKMWSTHKDCQSVIANSWKQEVNGCPLTVLSQKLKNLKVVLKDWNEVSFGDVHKRVEQAM